MNSCNLANTLLYQSLSAMQRMNSKLYALQRLGELMEQAANPISLMPNISKLLPLSQINLATYQQLQQSCPFLGLPDGLSALQDLQNKVLSAYQDLMRRLLNHPWLRLGSLQKMLDRFRNQFNIDLGKVNGYLRCAQAICGAAEALPGQLTDAQKTLDQYQQNFLVNSGNVMTVSMQAKWSQVDQVRAQLNVVMTN